MTVSVRRATVADAAGIGAVHLASWRVAYRDDAPAGWLDAQTLEERTESWGWRLGDGGDRGDRGDRSHGTGRSDRSDHAGRNGGTGSLTHVAVTAGDDAAAGTIVGFCGVAIPGRDRDADEDTAEIATFYVHPDHWRVGAGRALMAAALHDLAARGYETVTLWVLETNARARAFYAASGFADDGARMTQTQWPPQQRMRRAL